MYMWEIKTVSFIDIPVDQNRPNVLKEQKKNNKILFKIPIICMNNACDLDSSQIIHCHGLRLEKGLNSLA